MNEYYGLENNKGMPKILPKEVFEGEEELYNCLDCEAGGYVTTKRCPRPTNKDYLDECPLLSGDDPCELAKKYNMICKIHWFAKTKSHYTGKAVKQTTLGGI
jgi:hypothetical protein